MIAKIRNNPCLRIYLRDRIEDEGIEVGIDGNLSQNEYVGVKVDDYYNGLHQPTVPKSVDYVVVVDNSCDSYNLYILEMKNVNSPQKLVIKDIHEKFANTIADFLSEEFKEILLNVGIPVLLGNTIVRKAGKGSCAAICIRYVI